MIETKEKDSLIVDVNAESNSNVSEKNKQLFTKREWVLRYASPFGSLLFMAGPMILITIVNALYGIIDKQLTLNFAVNQIKEMYFNGTSGDLPFYVWSPNVALGTSVDVFAKQLINVSTQYSNTIITILTAFSVLTTVGAALRFGQSMGQRDKEKMDRYIITGIIQTAIMSALVTLILHFVFPFIITTQAGISYGDRAKSLQYTLAYDYSNLFILGFVLLAFETYVSTLLRTEGKVWWIIGISLISVVINIVLGTFFMEKLDMGMKGAVYGSMVAWGFTLISGLLVIAFSKNTLLVPNFKKYYFSIKEAMEVWYNGLSPFISNLVFAIISYTSTILIANLHDPANLSKDDIIHILVFAKDGNGNWINTVTGQPIDANIISNPEDPSGISDEDAWFKDAWFKNFASSGQTEESISTSVQLLSATSPWMNILYAPLLGMMQGGNANFAYNHGAGKRERMYKLYKIMIITMLAWTAIVMLCIAFLGGPMLNAFYGPVEKHWWFLAYYAFFILAPFTYSAMSLFQGMNKAKEALIISLMRTIVFQLLFIIIGFFVARAVSSDGSEDWAYFLLCSLAEIFASGVAIFILVRTLKKAKKQNRLYDDEDPFISPTYAEAIANEISIEQRKSSEFINHKFDAEIAKLKVSNRDQKIIEDQIQKLNEKRHLLLAKADVRAKLKYNVADVSSAYHAKIVDLRNQLKIAKQDNNQSKYNQIKELLISTKQERLSKIREAKEQNTLQKEAWLQDAYVNMQKDMKKRSEERDKFNEKNK